MKIVESSYGDPRARDTSLGQFQRYPERSQWVEFEVREYESGDQVRFERECSRWASSVVQGDWLPEGQICAKNAEHELAQLRLHVGLYLATRDDRGQSPSPPFRDAPNPSPYAETWEEYLRKAANLAPRGEVAPECYACMGSCHCDGLVHPSELDAALAQLNA